MCKQLSKIRAFKKEGYLSNVLNFAWSIHLRGEFERHVALIGEYTVAYEKESVAFKSVFHLGSLVTNLSNPCTAGDPLQ